MKTETKKEAIKEKAKLIAQGKTGVSIFKFATKRKKQFFVGDWWQWMSQIS